jgi:signal transduction histidine kinase
MMNLMANALEHTASGVVVAVGSSRTDDEVRLWVRDEGPGVPLGDRDTIFDRFVRGRAGRRPASGAGLGLAIVKAIAEAHKGTVSVETSPGGGATFTVTIPGTFGGAE